jgi:hypothetical protein
LASLKIKSMKIRFLTITLLVLTSTGILRAQVRVTGQEGANPITVAAPFLGFAPDSRGSAMGDLGVATSADAYSIHWNNAKLAFIENDMGASFSYSPWLGNIVDDMSLNYLTFFKKLSNIESWAVSMRYFDLGEIHLTDVTGVPQGIENPREAAVDATYSRLLGERFSAGLTLRFVWSNLTGNIVNAPSSNAGISLGFDLGALYRIPMMVGGNESELSFGGHMSNVGQRITYTSEENEDYIPGNLRLGTAFKTNIDAFNSFTFAFDANKLMVPTPPTLDDDGNIIAGKDPDRGFIAGTFGSFTDAPGGFQEEIQEITLSTGLEYWYRDIFAVRAGYFWEHVNKGDRKYFTTGMGFRYQVFGLDFSYLIPQQQNHPLGDTLRISFLFNLDKNDPNQI